MTKAPAKGDQMPAEALASWILPTLLRKLIVLMGLPASGKSTLGDYLEKLGAIRVSRDAIRKRLYGDENEIGDYKVVNREYYKELKEAMATGKPVLSDNVNLTPAHRRVTLEIAGEQGYSDVLIVWVDVPLDVCLERNRNRTRVVKEQVIRDMHASLLKEGPPREDEGDLLVLNNGPDKSTYVVAQTRPRKGELAPAPAKTAEPTDPAAAARQLAAQRALVGDLRVQLTLLDASVEAGRINWAGDTLSVLRKLADEGAVLFSTQVVPPTKPVPSGGFKKKPKAPAGTPEQVQAQLLKMIGDRPYATGEGPLICLSFNGHLLDKEKATLLLAPLVELVKRAHIICVQESNVDALRIIAKAARYGLNASHRNTREQACGILFHPRLHWLGKAPIYHDYLTDVPGHPEYKATLRPAIQRRVRDLGTGYILDIVNMHTKSNLGGPDETRPTRLWQFGALAAELDKQTKKSPYEPREHSRLLTAEAGVVGADGTKPVDNYGEELPLGAVIIGGDYNAPVEKPETTETAPLIAAGFSVVSTSDKRWSYQYRGKGGQFDGFFQRGVQVLECFIPPMPQDKTEAALYAEISDHMPVFTVIAVPTPPTKPDAPSATTGATTTSVADPATAVASPAEAASADSPAALPTSTPTVAPAT